MIELHRFPKGGITMDSTTKEKLKPYFKVYAIYVAVVLIWGRLFLGATDAMGYSLIVLYFLTPLLASITVFLLAAKTDFLTAVAALLIYAATNNLIQNIVFANSFRYLFLIHGILFVVVLIPGGICLLFGALKKFKSRSESKSE